MIAHILKLPLILILTGIAAASMFLPAFYALLLEQFHTARSFFYAGLLGLSGTASIGLAMWPQVRHRQASDLDNLLSLFLAYVLVPLLLALPFYEAMATTSFLNAYLEMVSAMTTTGLPVFDDPTRLGDPLHLWRAMIGWFGGLLIWVMAAAVLAPLNLGGFEVTASAEPGQGGTRLSQFEKASPQKRLRQITATLAPVYIGLTLLLWILLLINGERSLVALCHAMSTLATSGISPTGGIEGRPSGLGGEMVIFLFMLFGLSRLTFSSDTLTAERPGLWHDPEFRVGLFLILGIPTLLFLRHFISAIEIGEANSAFDALRALWGGIFTVLSFLTTTGFESSDWITARHWSGVGTPGLILLGLSLVGGGVATTAGGVKLLRVYALYLNGRREMERLIHPSSVSGAGSLDRRIRRKGAFIAWVFFMLVALSLAFFTLAFAALGQELEEAMVLSIAAIATTGPLVSLGGELPIDVLALSGGVKLTLCAGMILGRLETLAIIALFNPGLWRN